MIRQKEKAGSVRMGTKSAVSRKSLLYMYVENFCGLEHMGFNFAMYPRFLMSESSNKYTLRMEKTVTQYDEYWNDHSFFGENISALTLLIGENGSGKTTLFRLLLKWLRELAAGVIPEEGGVLYFREKDDGGNYKDLYISFSDLAIRRNIEMESIIAKNAKEASIGDIQQFLSDVSVTYYTDTMTDLELPPLLAEKQYQDTQRQSSFHFTDHSLISRLISNLPNIKSNDLSHYILRQMDFTFQAKHLLDQPYNGHDSRDIPIDYLRVTSNYRWQAEKIDQRLKMLQTKNADIDSLRVTFESFHKLWQQRIEAIDNIYAIQLMISGSLCLAFIALLLQFANEASSEIFRTISAGLFRANESLLNDSGTNRYDIYPVENFISVASDFINNVALFFDEGSDVSSYAQKAVALLGHIKWSDSLMWERHSQLNEDSLEWIVEVSKIRSQSDVLEGFLAFIRGYEGLPELTDFCRFEWHYPSSGESNYSNLIAVLVSDQTEDQNHWFFLDEPDNAFHPEWKRNAIQHILNYCEKQPAFSFQFWISTHSPIMLSDIPRAGSIFLRRKRSYVESAKIQVKQQANTFAQQIYALFNDAFFMDKGIVGAFANKCIQEICEKLEMIEKKASRCRFRETPKELFDKEEQKISAVIEQIDEPLVKGYLMARVDQCKKAIKALPENAAKKRAPLGDAHDSSKT